MKNNRWILALTALLFMTGTGYADTLPAANGNGTSTFYAPFTSMLYPNFSLVPFVHQYTGSYSFEGDSHGDFAGDLVAVLEDGSCWKVHPKHAEQFQKWAPGQLVHVGLRETHYFFKREHKFTLVNHNLKEEVFVMLVATPISVSNSNQSIPTVKVVSSKGDTVKENYYDYKRNITLNDGIFWEIESEKTDAYYGYGTPAYVGYNSRSENDVVVQFFIINGKEREAISRLARPGNFFYLW